MRGAKASTFGTILCSIIIAIAGFLPVVSGFIGGAALTTATKSLYSRHPCRIRTPSNKDGRRKQSQSSTTAGPLLWRRRDVSLTCIRMDFDFGSGEGFAKDSLCFDYATQIPASSPVSDLHRGRARKGSAEYEPDYTDICIARSRLKNSIKYTDCSKHEGISKQTGANVFFKKEYQQYTGAFKERGARNTLQNLLEEARRDGTDLRDKGVVAASAGNHALGLAYHGGRMNIPVTVVMPLGAPMTKVNRCKEMGARVVQHGINFGAGTIGIEILEQLPFVEAVVVPVGGGGLIAGIALAIKTHRPDVMIIGVEPENAPSMSEAMRNGAPTEVQVKSTIADGLSVPKVGQKSFNVASRYVDKVVTVREELIPLAILRLVEMERAVIEGGGAIGLAALLPGGPLEGLLAGKNVCTVLSGGNIDSTTLGRIIDRGLAADRRLLRFQLMVKDSPGHLMELASVIAGTGANVKDIFHDRAWTPGSIDMLTVTVTVELGGRDHEAKLKHALTEQHKYKLVQWQE